MFLFAQLQHRQKSFVCLPRLGLFQQLLHRGFRKLALPDGEVLAGGGLLGGGGFGWGGGGQVHAPDAAVVCAGLEGELTADGFRQVTRMIDVLADHVAQIQRAVGADSGVDRAKPLVGCGKKIAAGRGVRGGVGGPGGGKNLALHEVLRGLANERTVSADDDSAGAGVGAGVLATDEAGNVARRRGVRTERIHLGRDRDDVLDGASE